MEIMRQNPKGFSILYQKGGILALLLIPDQRERKVLERRWGWGDGGGVGVVVGKQDITDGKTA
jgi:hypothetical protein